MSLRRSLIEKDDSDISISRKCELLGVNRASFYYKPKPMSKDEIARRELIMQKIDFIHTSKPYMGAKKIAKKIKREHGMDVGKKLTRKLMEQMGIYCIYPKPNTSKASKHHKKFPYLLYNMDIFLPNQVWAIDITYIRMGRGHMYLTAIIDWATRYIVGWALSDTLEAAPIIDCLKATIEAHGSPGIINTDQGSQFTSDDYTALLQGLRIRQSMDGKGRWVDNRIIERWFRSLKCDDIYINDYNTPKELRRGIAAYISEYNTERPHQSLDYAYPADIYRYNPEFYKAA
jgi:putative transposase